MGRLTAVLVAVMVSFVITGAGQVSPVTRGPEHQEAARAVAVLTGLVEGDVAASVPEGFTEQMGYAVEVVTVPDGADRLVRVDGDCSTPFGATVFDFDRACKTHDYGYALLRFATRNGGELGPWARIAIDDLLAADLLARCEELGEGRGGGATCRAAAGAGAAAVRVNSWRQGQGAPGIEDPAPYLVSGGLILACLAVPGGRIGRAVRGLRWPVSADRGGEALTERRGTRRGSVTT